MKRNILSKKENIMKSFTFAKKTFAVILVLCMLCSMLTLIPLTASAAASDSTVGSESEPIEICTAEDFKALPESLAAAYAARGTNAALFTYYVEITRDIDFGGETLPVIELEGYSVSIDGRNHVLSDFQSEYGLFASLGEDSTVKNLAVVGATISCTSGGAGAFVGTATDGFSIENCSTDETTTVTNRSSSPTGGLVGQTTNGTSNANIYLRDCTNNATVTAAGGSVGGIIGQINNNYSHVIVRNCANNGAISGGKHSGGIIGSVTDILLFDLLESMNSASVSTTNSSGYAGGLVGYATCYTASTETWTVRYCKNTGAVSAPTYAGGIIGYSSGSPAYRVSYTGNTGAVTATSTSSAVYIGGILGYQKQSNYSRYVSFSDCYNEGKLTVSGTASYSRKHYSGGILGYFDAKGCSTITVTRCYDLGERSVTSGSYAKHGIIVGYLKNGTTQNVTDCKGISRTNATSIVADGTVTSTGSATISSKNDIASTMTELERNVMLRRPKGDGSKENPYLIGTDMQLQYFAKQLSFDNETYVELTADIDFGGYSINIDLLDTGYTFRTVHMNGNGHTLSNYQSYGGIFSRVGPNSSIVNLRVKDATINNPSSSGYYHVGALIGYAEDSLTLVNCSTENVTITQNKADKVVGGLVGSVEVKKGNGLALFVDCVNYADVTSNCREAGGILAKVYQTGCEVVFMNCANYGTITSTAANAPVGGIMGSTGKSGSASFYNCTNNGQIITTASNPAGGIVGDAPSSMTGVLFMQNCHNTASVSSSSVAGALIGRATASGAETWTLAGCTNSGSVASRVGSTSNVTLNEKNVTFSDIKTKSENISLSVRIKLTDDFGLMAITEISKNGKAQNLSSYTEYGFYFMESDTYVSPATLMASGKKVKGLAYNDSKTIFLAM